MSRIYPAVHECIALPGGSVTLERIVTLSCFHSRPELGGASLNSLSLFVVCTLCDSLIVEAVIDLNSKT